MTCEGRLEKLGAGLRQSKQLGIMRKEIGKAGMQQQKTPKVAFVASFPFCLTDWLLLVSHII
eukprot:scaffold3521_cov151-Skeletonema_dohrnii-CCMP3373.AAC.8